MPVENYGVWKGVAAHYEVEHNIDDPRSPHLSLYYHDSEGVAPKFDPQYRHKQKHKPKFQRGQKEIPGLFRAAINIKSGDKRDSRLVYWVNYNVVKHPIVERLVNMDFGFHPLDEINEEGLDYIRSDLFKNTSGRVLPHDIPGPNNDIIDVLEPEVRKAVADHADLYLFGSCFNTRNGIHNVHMNQGNIPEYRQDDGVFQDGGLFIHHKDSNRWIGVFLGFASQAIHTDDDDGHAIGPMTWAELLPTEHIENTLAIKEALVNPGPQGQQRGSVTLANLTSHKVPLSSWKLHNAAGQVQELPRGTVLDSMSTGGFEVPNCPLSKDGDTITLLNEQGLKVDGVSYNSFQGSVQGRPIVFSH